MPYIIVLIITPIYMILSVLVGKLIYILLSPQYSFVSELGLLPVKSIENINKPDAAIVPAVILPCIMLTVYAGIIALWIKEVMKKR
jgi:hypothetical protein